MHFEQTNSAFWGMVDFPEVLGMKLISNDGKELATSGITTDSHHYNEVQTNKVNTVTLHCSSPIPKAMRQKPFA